MKISIKSVLIALGAVGMSAMMTLPARTQQFKPRDGGCDNVSTKRDATLKPDNRCLQGGSETFQQEQARVFAFIHANPPTKTTKDKAGGVVYQGTDRASGQPYEIYSGQTSIGGYVGRSLKFSGSGGSGSKSSGIKPR